MNKMKYLIPIFIILPALEIGAFLLASHTLGIWSTILLIVLTGFLGAYLMKRQGLETFRNANSMIQNGVAPGEVLIDGISILLGGLLLLSPGFITDFLGLYLLLPFTRKTVKPLIRRAIRNWIDKNTFTVIR